MSCTTSLIGDLTKIKTGKLDANAASMTGQYPFFTCAQEPLTIDRYAYDCDAILVAGNGDLNVKHYKGKFEAYQRTYIIQVANESKLDSRYLYYFMSKYVDKLRELSIGGVIKYIKLGMLTDAEIPLPPLTEQKRIAAILDKADAIRRKRQQAIGLADDFLRAVFLDMFGDPVTNPKGWEVVTLSELVEDGRPITYGILKPGDHTPGGVPMLRIQDIKNGEIEIENLHYVSNELSTQYKRTILKGGEIVISLVGTIGLIASVPSSLKGANIHRNLGLIAPGNKINPIYMHFLMALPEFLTLLEKVTKGGIQRLLNLGDLNSVPIILPNLNLQESFANIAIYHQSKICKKIGVSRNDFETLFNSLCQRAFRGEL